MNIDEELEKARIEANFLAYSRGYAARSAAHSARSATYSAALSAVGSRVSLGGYSEEQLEQVRIIREML